METDPIRGMKVSKKDALKLEQNRKHIIFVRKDAGIILLTRRSVLYVQIMNL